MVEPNTNTSTNNTSTLQQRRRRRRKAAAGLALTVVAAMESGMHLAESDKYDTKESKERKRVEKWRRKMRGMKK